MLVLSHSRSAAQQQVCSRKTTAAAETCKILFLLLVTLDLVVQINNLQAKLMLVVCKLQTLHGSARIKKHLHQVTA